MATLEIVQLGHPTLRKIAKTVSSDEIRYFQQVQQLVDNMIEVLHESGGVGLAAPQVNEEVRLFIAEAHPSERRPHIQNLDLLVVINPEYTVVDTTWDMDWEGCLSIQQGDIMGIVKRFSRIHVEGLDRNGDVIERDFDGFHARIIQHEIDHLSGILFFDRIYERRAPKEEIVLATRENYNAFWKESKQSEVKPEDNQS